MRVRVLAVPVAVIAWGCLGNPAAPHPGETGSCTMVLSGAVTGTYDCRPAYTQWDSTADLGGFSFQVAASGAHPAIWVAVSWPGTPAVASYTNLDAGASASLLVTASSSQWAAAAGAGVTPAGSYVLTLTSVAGNGVTSGGLAYRADGTLAATLPAVAGTSASGTVNLSVTF